jgi:hypothetical protein
MTRFQPNWLQAGSYAASQDRAVLGALWPSAACTGLIVSPVSGTTVQIAPGTAAVPSANGTGTVLCHSDAVEQVILPAAGSTARTDLIVVDPRSVDLGGTAEEDFRFWYVQGVEGAGVPSAPTGQLVLAQVNRPGGSATIAPVDIIDVRPFGGLSVPAPPIKAGIFDMYMGSLNAGTYDGATFDLPAPDVPCQMVGVTGGTHGYGALTSTMTYEIRRRDTNVSIMTPASSGAVHAPSGQMMGVASFPLSIARIDPGQVIGLYIHVVIASSNNWCAPRMNWQLLPL